MSDVLSSASRRLCMSNIRGKNTKPELLVRRLLFVRGYRYRLHHRLLPGKPDIVLQKYKGVIFIHGCFWHGHDCHLFRLPSTNRRFWRRKIAKNRCNDDRSRKELRRLGWRVLDVWECAVKSPTRQTP